MPGDSKREVAEDGVRAFVVGDGVLQFEDDEVILSDLCGPRN